MKKLLRTGVVAVLSALLAITIWYHNDSSRALAELKERLELAFSEASGSSVVFSRLGFSFPFSLVIRGIEISSPDTGASLGKIENLSITPEIWTLLSGDTLVVALSAQGIETTEASATLSARIDIPKKNDLIQTLGSPVIKTIELTGGEISFREYRLRKITGNLDLGSGGLTGAEVLFSFKGEDFLANFSKTPQEKTCFSGTLRSMDYTLKGRFYPDDDILAVDNLKGKVLSFNADIFGSISDLSVPGKRTVRLKGYVGGGLKNVILLAMGREKAEDPVFRDGLFTAAFDAGFKEDDIKNISVSANIKADKLPLNNLEIRDISGKLNVNSGILAVSDMTFFVAGYPAGLSLKMNVYDESLPVSFTASASKMDLTRTLNGINLANKNNYGPCDLEISFSGSGKKLYTAARYFAETGSIYPDGSIFSGMEMSGLVKLKNYSDENNRFDDIIAEFFLKNGYLEATDLFFRSFGGEFSGKGGISFTEPGMPVFGDLSVKIPDPDLLPKDFLGNNYRMQGPVKLDVSFRGPGKLISDFFKKPVPGAESFSREDDGNLWRRLLLPEYRHRLPEVTLTSSSEIRKLYCSGILLEDVKAAITLDKGTFAFPSLLFRAFGGSVNGKFKISPPERGIPVSVDLYLKDISPSLIPRNMLDTSAIDPGLLDLDISFSGSGSFLSAIVKDMSGNTSEKEILRKFWRTLLKNEYRDPLARTRAGLRFRLSGMDYKGIRLNKIELDASASDGNIDLPYFYASHKNSSLSGTAWLGIDYADFPVKFSSVLKQADLSEISTKLLSSPGLAEGPGDVAFSFAGHGRVLSEVERHIAAVGKRDNPSSLEKLHSALLFMSEKGLFRNQFFRSSFSLKTLRAGNVRFDNIFGDMVLDNSFFSVPSLTAIFYRGVLSCNLKCDLGTLGFPFSFNAEIKRADLMALVKETMDKKSVVHGNFDFNVQAFGKAEYQTTYAGEGALAIYDANLGRVPILTPLLGWIYEGLEDVFPAFKKINIDSAGATFDIKDRKLITQDLVLSGSDICLIAEGSLDFDGRLDFSFENELIEQRQPEEEDWPVSVRNFITSFGKTISRARLRGTLKDQKWEFEYFAPIRNAISGNVKAFFEGLSG